MQELSREQGARQIALDLMAEHGLLSWSFDLNTNVRRAGVCFYLGRTRAGRIELSIHFIERNSEADILDTILHEIAHALVGVGHGHDEVWKAKCREIGAKPERCYDSSEIDMPKGKWQSQCGCCEKKFYRHRKPKQLVGWHCRACGKERGPLVWSVNAQP